MAFDYDKFYEENPSGLGDPTQIFVDFFKERAGAPLRVLDLGCGQGRDALFIARLGHSVVGVDISPNGIRELIATAKKESLDIEGITADIVTFVPQGQFDVVLVDRTLHMLPEAPRLEVLERLVQSISEDGWVLIADETSNIPRFKEVLETSAFSWKIELAVRGNLFARRT